MEYVYCNIIEQCKLTCRVSQKSLYTCSKNSKTALFSILQSTWFDAHVESNCPFLKQCINVLGLPGCIRSLW